MKQTTLFCGSTLHGFWVRLGIRTLIVTVPLASGLSCSWNKNRPSADGGVPSDVNTLHSTLGENTKSFYDFCSRTGLSASLTDPAPWSGEMVQKVLTDLIESPEIKQTPWLAYPIAYRRMTAARDKARCGGALTGTGLGMDGKTLQGSQLINHHLADIMTRWLVLQTKTCAQNPQGGLASSGLCGLMYEQAQKKYDFLSSAMSTTGIYISSHIAISLAAVMADDRFWDQFPDPQTHRTSEPIHTIPAARFTWLDRYKSHFDLFNDFLATNISTVADALGEANLLNNRNLAIAAQISQLGICRASFFGNIRDRAFQATRDYLKGTLIAQHPMLTKEDNGRRLGLDYGHFNFKAPLPKSILDVETFALAAVASPATRLIYQNLLGGVSHESWSANQICPNP